MESDLPKISFKKPRLAVEVPVGANLMESLQNAQIPVASSCGGEAVCAKCKITIVSGRENLSPENQNEKDLREIHDLSKEVRISCQVSVLGDVTVDADYW